MKNAKVIQTLTRAIHGGSFEKLTVAQWPGTRKVNLRASEEREKAIQAATKAVSEGQSNAPMPLIRLDRLAVPRDAIYLQTSQKRRTSNANIISPCSAWLSKVTGNTPLIVFSRI